MEFIRSIVAVIDGGQFSQNLGDSTQLREFYELVKRNKVQTDEEARIALYGTKGSTSAYKKLKQRLSEKLSEHVLHNGVSAKNLDDYSRLYRKSMTKALAIKSLMLSNARAAAVKIAENVIKTTIRNEYTDLTLYISRELFFYYSSINYSKNKRSKYEKIMDNAQKLYNMELEANKYYCDMRVVIGASRGSKKEYALSRATIYTRKVSEFVKLQPVSYELLLKSYLVIAMRYELANDFKNLLKTCDEAISVFKSRRVNRQSAFYLFDARRILCYIQFEMNERAEKLARSYIEKMTPGSVNWFDLNIQILRSQLHSGEYEKAYKTINRVRESRAFERQPDNILQAWIVYEAYIEFLVRVDQINVESDSKFRLYKFLNEIPIYAKDKRGFNISILVVHVLFLLLQKKYNQIIDRVDALNQYCHRHLRRDDTFRSNCFVKMLLQLAKANFNKKRAERYVQPYLRKLHSMPVTFLDQAIEVEIIPYEKLWSMVLELLD